MAEMVWKCDRCKRDQTAEKKSTRVSIFTVDLFRNFMGTPLMMLPGQVMDLCDECANLVVTRIVEAMALQPPPGLECPGCHRIFAGLTDDGCCVNCTQRGVS